VSLPSLLLDALFPDSCLSCLAPKRPDWRHDVACDACLDGVPLPQRFRCIACQAPGTAPLLGCHPAAGTSLAIATSGSRVLGSLASALLYEGITRAAPAIADVMAACVATSGMPLHRTIAVPLPESPHLTRSRGFAPHDLLASSLASCLDLACEPHVLSATSVAGRQVFGIGRPGDAAAARQVLAVSAALPATRDLESIVGLIRAACPRAAVTFVAATD